MHIAQVTKGFNQPLILSWIDILLILTLRQLYHRFSRSNGSIRMFHSNFFNISSAYYLWCMSNPLLDLWNSMSGKYVMRSRLVTSNYFISSLLNFEMQFLLLLVINKSSTYGQSIITHSLVFVFTYTPCSNTYLLKPTSFNSWFLTTKLEVILYTSLLQAVR